MQSEQLGPYVQSAIDMARIRCIGLAFGMVKGHHALIMTAEATITRDQVMESIQLSNRWKTETICFVPFNREAVKQFLDGQPNDGIARVPYLEICLGTAIIHRFGRTAAQ